nr:unnamed protein product [Callosobruchus chinensis]
MESAKKTRSRTKSGQGDTLDTVTSDTEATLNGERPKKEEESVIEAEDHDAEQQADEEEPKSDKPSEEITSTENSTERQIKQILQML